MINDNNPPYFGFDILLDEEGYWNVTKDGEILGRFALRREAEASVRLSSLSGN